MSNTQPRIESLPIGNEQQGLLERLNGERSPLNGFAAIRAAGLGNDNVVVCQNSADAKQHLAGWRLPEVSTENGPFPSDSSGAGV